MSYMKMNIEETIDAVMTLVFISKSMNQIYLKKDMLINNPDDLHCIKMKSLRLLQLFQFVFPSLFDVKTKNYH